MSRVITDAFYYFDSELCPFDELYAYFVLWPTVFFL